MIDLEQLTKSFEFRHFCLPIKLTYRFIVDGEILPEFITRLGLTSLGKEVRILAIMEVTVPDRETGEPIVVKTQKEIHWCEIRDEKSFANIIFHMVQNFVMHEAAESFHFNGERIYDPHR